MPERWRDRKMRVSDVFEDSRGVLWLGSNIGVVKIDDGGRTYLTADDGLPLATVSAIAEDAAGALWFASEDQPGLARLDARGFQMFLPPDHGMMDGALGLAPAADGTMWVATRVGLLSFVDGCFTLMNEGDGLPSRNMSSVLVDRSGRVWGATFGGGVFVYDGRNIQVLTERDGLPSNYVSDLIEDADGAILIGAYRGLCRYTPGAASRPHIRLRGVDADRIHRGVDSTVTVHGSETPVRIRFCGTALLTSRMRYSYMLDGYDKDWRATWKEEAQYDGLPVGDYTFRVKAVNRDLVESAIPAEINISVKADPRDATIARLQETAEERENIHRALIRAIPDLLFRVRRDGTVTHAAPSESIALFNPPEKLLGRPVEEFLSDSMTATVRGHIHHPSSPEHRRGAEP